MICNRNIHLFSILITTFLAFNAESSELKLEHKYDSSLDEFSFALNLYENDSMIARKVYKKGKIVVQEGVFPKQFDNVIFEPIGYPFTITEPGAEKVPLHGAIFYKNGKVIAERLVRGGELEMKGEIPDGTALHLDENGTIRGAISYKEGTWNGPAIYFHPDGVLKTEGFYKNGYAEGRTNIYYKSGKIMAEIELRNGREISRKEYKDE